MANGWTEERRVRQSALIHSWKPWEHSTGAKTAKGKLISSQNRKKSIDQAVADFKLAEAKLLKILPSYHKKCFALMFVNSGKF